ncbi:hypothetical protein [Enterococcus gallinarum]|nr:hypothetical protein [Enterococcus gallinarum]MCR1944789.1 hypothetical protein [Enterococcus gallinarum]
MALVNLKQSSLTEQQKEAINLSATNASLLAEVIAALADNI